MSVRNCKLQLSTKKTGLDTEFLPFTDMCHVAAAIEARDCPVSCIIA